MGFTPWAAHKMKAIVYISVINTFSYRQTVMNYLIEADWCKRPREKVEYEAYIETRRKFLFFFPFWAVHFSGACSCDAAQKLSFINFLSI